MQQSQTTARPLSPVRAMLQPPRVAARARARRRHSPRPGQRTVAAALRVVGARADPALRALPSGAVDVSVWLAQNSAEEAANVASDGVEMAFQREVSGVENMNLGLGEITLEGPSTVRAKDSVVATPYSQQGHLASPEVLVHPRVQLDVAGIAPEELQLDLVIAGPVEQRLIVGPGVRTDQARVGHAVQILPAGALQAQRTTDCRLGVGTGRSRVGEQWLPERVDEPIGVSVAVLRDDRADLVGEPSCEAPADGSAVVLHVKRVLVEAKLSEQLSDNIGEGFERVGERLERRRRGVTEAEVVRGDDVVAIGQCRDEVAEHMRAGREAVQEHDGRRVARTGLSEEDLLAFDGHSSVSDGNHR